MPKFCRRCGASLSEEAKFCRQCGASTTPTETVIQPENQDSVPLPTTLLDKTEPMTSIMPEPTQLLSQPPTTGSLKQPRSFKWVGLVGLMVIIAVSAFFVGSRLTSEDNSIQSQQPVVESTPSTQPAEANTPPSTSDLLPPQPPTSPPPPKTEVTHGEPKPESSAPSPVDNVATANSNDSPLKRGTDFLSAKNYDAALKEFEKLRRMQPGNKDVYYLIGQTYHLQGQLDLALQAYEKCTSGPYASIARQHVERLRKKLGKSD